MKWEPLACGSPSPCPREGYTLSVLENRRVVLYGGRGGDAGTVLADPAQLHPLVDGRKHPGIHGASLPGRTRHAACVLSERSAILFLGGEDEEGTPLMAPVLLEVPTFGDWHW